MPSELSGVRSRFFIGCDRAVAQHPGHEVEQLAERRDARDLPRGDVLDAADHVTGRSSAPVQMQNEGAVRA